MARHTLEIRQIVNSNNMKLFDFEYDFFDENLKSDFEKLFIDYFYFREIGQETLERFKHELRTKLNLINHYYKEYYRTVKQVEIEEFMITKDATDTFTRTYLSEGISEGEINSINKVTNNGNSMDKAFDTPRNKLNILDNVVSSATSSENNVNSNSEDNQKSKGVNNNKITETTVLHSKGDLGVTSSGFLIEGWRNVITNIYQMIFDECEELFYGLY